MLIFLLIYTGLYDKIYLLFLLIWIQTQTFSMPGSSHRCSTLMNNPLGSQWEQKAYNFKSNKQLICNKNHRKLRNNTKKYIFQRNFDVWFVIIFHIQFCMSWYRLVPCYCAVVCWFCLLFEQYKWYIITTRYVNFLNLNTTILNYKVYKDAHDKITAFCLFGGRITITP